MIQIRVALEGHVVELLEQAQAAAIAGKQKGVDSAPGGRGAVPFP